MKEIARYNSLLLLLVFAGLCTAAQSIPAPVIWFSFDRSGTLAYQADYGHAKVKTYNGHTVNRVADRFGNTAKAFNFWVLHDRQTTLVTADETNEDPSSVKLFGYSGNNTALPDTFTISCWVYFAAHETPVALARKIFYADYDDSRFALIHKGAQIYLRRMARNAATATDNRFDYLFGEPASFDAGTGWYHVILVMGRRAADKAKYCKLYVGKPAHVKYDATGPRTVATTTDVLAPDFGGAYAFTGVQDFMNSNVTAWGLGNADDNDPVHGTSIAPVMDIDDFAVWDGALTDNQARDLFNCQKANPANACWNAPGQNAGTARPSLQITATDQPAEKAPTAISVSPNPTSGELWVQLPPDNANSTTSFTFTDLSGKILYTRTTVAGKTGQSVRLDMRSITKANGIYLLQVTNKTQVKLLK